MRPSAPILAALAIILLPATVLAQADVPDIRAELRGQFEGSAQKFVALAEAMPGETYAWTPGEGVATVARVYAHVARYNYLYPETSLGVAPGEGVRYADWEEELSDKAEVVAALTESMDHVRRVIDEMSDEELHARTRLYGRDVAGWAVVLQLVAHMNEHLGQAIAYARMNGVVPPWSR
jgi:uncharacterized damage-inducible protein DinB